MFEDMEPLGGGWQSVTMGTPLKVEAFPGTIRELSEDLSTWLHLSVLQIPLQMVTITAPSLGL